jgi:hypothetical protein
MTLKTGDHVWIDFDGRKVEGKIVMASENERSLMLAFDAMLGGHVGMMPVLLEDDGVYRSIVTGKAVAVVPREAT